MSLSPDQLEALRQVRRALGRQTPVLIGASALAVQLDYRWRQTNDLDVSVSVGVEQLDRLPLPKTWRKDPKVEHRWLTPKGVKVDVLPAGPKAQKEGELRWPVSGNLMRTTGFRLVFERRRTVTEGRRSFDVAPVPVVALLKMVAYQDAPHERERDLEDLALILVDYPPEDSRFSAEAAEQGLSYDEAGPYLLGREMGSMANADERGAIEAFVAKALDERDPHATLAKLARAGRGRWDDQASETATALLRALRRGLESVRIL